MSAVNISGLEFFTLVKSIVYRLNFIVILIFVIFGLEHNAIGFLEGFAFEEYGEFCANVR